LSSFFSFSFLAYEPAAPRKVDGGVFDHAAFWSFFGTSNWCFSTFLKYPLAGRILFFFVGRVPPFFAALKTKGRVLAFL